MIRGGIFSDRAGSVHFRCVKQGGAYMKKILIVLFIFISVASVVYFTVFGAKESPADKKISIGVIAPLTGDSASFGFSIRKGVELARNDLLADDVEVIYEDSACTPEQAVAAVRSLLEHQVSAIIGEACSGATLAVSPLVNEHKVVLISPASTNPDISSLGGEYVFRTIPSDALQGKYAAELLFDRSFRKLGIIYTDEPYGQGLYRVLSQSFTDLGGQVSAAEKVPVTSINVGSQVDKIRLSQPDVLFIISNSPKTASAVIRDAKNRNFKPVIYGSEALMDASFISDLGPLAEGITITAVTTGSEKFIQKHKVEYQETPGAFAAQSYDAFWALYQAIKKGAGTGQEIKDALGGVIFDGVSGPISFDGNGDVTGKYDILTVKNGSFVRELE